MFTTSLLGDQPSAPGLARQYNLRDKLQLFSEDYSGLKTLSSLMPLSSSGRAQARVWRKKRDNVSSSPLKACHKRPDSGRTVSTGPMALVFASAGLPQPPRGRESQSTIPQRSATVLWMQMISYLPVRSNGRTAEQRYGVSIVGSLAREACGPVFTWHSDSEGGRDGWHFPVRHS